eukprot:15431381-Alexandrium_andersonii.AAC.1
MRRGNAVDRRGRRRAVRHPKPSMNAASADQYQLTKLMVQSGGDTGLQWREVVQLLRTEGREQLGPCGVQASGRCAARGLRGCD